MAEGEGGIDSWYLRRRLIEGDETELLEYFNRFNLVEAYDEMMGTHQYVFITRPDMNLIEGEELVDGIKKIPYMSELYRHEYGKKILESFQQDTGFNGGFIPVLFNKVRGYTPVDDENEAIERGESIFGHKIIYGKHNIKTRAAGTIQLPFKENKNLVVYKTIKAWCDYIENVSLGLCAPKRKYIRRPQLDYAVSIFYIVVDRSMKLLYWEKLIGCFPVNVPNSSFAYTYGNIIDPEYNITFRYSIKDRSLNPVILSEFNDLSHSTDDPDSYYVPLWDTARDMHGIPYVNTPFVVRKGEDFYLRWK